jgi:hypothetical protein
MSNAQKQESWGENENENENEKKVPSPSRAEVEHLCVLSVLSDAGHSNEQLAAALGLAPGLAAVMPQVIEQLVKLGAVEEHEGRAFATDVGRAWLGRRLDEWGLSGGARSI